MTRLAGVALVATSIFLLFRSRRWVGEGLRSLLWPRVPATVQRSEVGQTDGIYAPQIEYTYEAAGRRHVGTRVRLEESQVSVPDFAARTVAWYPVGAQVRVSVDPRDPASAVLRPGFDGGGLFVVGFILTLGAIGAALLLEGSPRALVILLRLFFLGIGATTTWLGIRSVREGNRAHRWPTAPGRIVSSRIERDDREDETGIRRRYFFVSVQYVYEVDGKTLEGNRVGIGAGSASSETAAQEQVARYAAGTVVRVHYDPQVPLSAVLEPGVKSGAVPLFAVGLPMIALALWWPWEHQ